jgi:hypothetical protein
MEKSDEVELYQKVFKLIRKVLNYIDPESLDPGRPGGAPVDEYDLETAPITAFFVRNLGALWKDSHLLKREIDRIWEKCFDRKCPGSEAIATEILREIERI